MIRLYRQNKTRDDTCEWMIYTDDNSYRGANTLIDLFEMAMRELFTGGDEDTFVKSKAFDFIFESASVEEMFNVLIDVYPEEFI